MIHLTKPDRAYVTGNENEKVLLNFFFLKRPWSNSVTRKHIMKSHNENTEEGPVHTRKTKTVVIVKLIQFNSISNQIYLYSAKSQQMLSQGTSKIQSNSSQLDCTVQFTVQL